MNTEYTISPMLRFLSFFIGVLFISINDVYAQADSVKHRLILIGDAGNLINGHSPVVEKVMANYDLTDTINTILFLGDNVYPKGLPSKYAPHYDQYTAVLKAQAQLGLNKKAKVFWIPGNHDWAQGRSYGFNNILSQNELIDSLNQPNLIFLPKLGCPGPDEIQLSKQITLVILDTQWWLQEYEKPGISSACACKTEDEVLTALGDIAARNEGKLLILATHHPFKSYGIHGGYFTLKQHLFPFTDLSKNLYIPLPVIGSIYPITRGVFGNIQDIQNPIYSKMAQSIQTVLKDRQVIYISGHDHNLQWIQANNQNFIISGSGSEATRVKQGKDSQFARSELGFAVLEVLTDGSMRLKFIGIKVNETTPLLTASLGKIITKSTEVVAGKEPENKSFPDSIITSADSQYDNVGKFHRKMFGQNYRKDWAMPVKFRVFKLSEEKGGLTIEKRGGGFQTKSLRLVDKNGHEWVLRSIKKFPIEAIPVDLRETIAKDVVQDQISAANPYAALTVPVLAHADSVPHTNPEIVYIPDDPAFGIYRRDFANSICLFEERTPLDVGKTDNTFEVLEQLQNDNDNRVIQDEVLRARLLDLLIGDWDRHEDQWRWSYYKQGKAKVFSPIPRDRDQVFFINEGVISRMAAKPWILPAIQGFRTNFPNINTFSFNARYFDRSFLSEPSAEDWKLQAEKLVLNMTDSVFKEAISKMPPQIDSLSGQRFFETLKARRSIFVEQAMMYYSFLAREVDVVGSNKNELFRVDYQPDGKVAVEVFKKGKSEVLSLMYKRVFDPKETQEIRLYGLEGEDSFDLVGDKKSPIKVRIIGGPGRDNYADSLKNKNRYWLYDQLTEKNIVEEGSSARLRLSDEPEVNEYNRRAFQYNKTIPLLTGAYNSDDGVSLGLGVKFIKHGFRKIPQASLQTATVSHSLATKAYNFKYVGDFTNVIGKANLFARADIRAPSNTTNFFGLGNESEYNKENDKSFYRARYNLYAGELLLKYDWNSVHLGFGPLVELVQMDADDNLNRFVNDPFVTGLDSASLYDKKSYVALSVYNIIDTRDKTILPNRGIWWNSNLRFVEGLTNTSNSNIRLESDLRIYMSFQIPARVVLSTRFGAGVIWGDYEFFHAMTLGGNENLRGFRNYRFAGNASLYNNTELQIKLFDFKSFIFPGTFGMLLFNDIGRVWLKGEDSTNWHDGYGGGIYVSPVNRALFTGTVGISKEGVLPYIGLGIKF